MEVKLSIRKTIKLLSNVIIVLAVLSVLSLLYKYEFNNGEDRYITVMLDMGEERNFPTFYATLALYFCSFLLIMISSVKKVAKDKFHRHWFILGIIFFLIGTDEILILHEQTIAPLRSLLNTTGILYQAWVIPAIIFLIVFFIYYLKFLIHLPPYFRFLFILSGAIFVFGAVGMELIQGKIVETQGENLFYALLTNVEELLEKLGILFFIYALLSYIKVNLNTELKLAVVE